VPLLQIGRVIVSDPNCALSINKAAGYGGASGARAVEQLRLNLAEVQMATVRNQVLLSLYTDFENFSVFKPGPTKEQSVNDMLDQLIAWGGALKTLRTT
jgi:NAD(P)H-dependent FMN reductase